MKLDYERIGKRIKEKRKSKKISQAQLAELSDLSVKYISQIERAVRHASLDTIATIADILEVTVDMLLYGSRVCACSERISDPTEILTDCGSYERQIICEVAQALKSILFKYK